MLGGYVDFLICQVSETTFKTISGGYLDIFNSLRGRIPGFIGDGGEVDNHLYLRGWSRLFPFLNGLNPINFNQQTSHALVHTFVLTDMDKTFKHYLTSLHQIILQKWHFLIIIYFALLFIDIVF
jgi:hypothetical protein